MRLPAFLASPDVFERHYLVARLAERFQPATILDVGGERRGLERFTQAQVTALNVDDSGDMSYDGKAIPCADGAYDVVTAIDVLEHIPPAARAPFVAELCRVARKGIVLAAPFGTELHRTIEQEAERLVNKATGGGTETARFLREHLEYGLPTLQEIEGLFAAYRREIWFAGDCRRAFARFRRGLRLRKFTRHLGLLGELLVIMVQANWFRRHGLAREAREWSNRIYVVCDLRAVCREDSGSPASATGGAH